MQVHRTYPEQTARSFYRRNRLNLWRSVFLTIGYVCALINLCTGGIPWSLLVAGGLCVLWIAFLYRPLVENTLIKKMADVGIAVCLFLFLLDAIVGGGWSEFVVPIVFFGDLLVIGFYYLVYFKKEKRNLLPLYELILAGLVATLCRFVGVHTLNWPLIVVGSVSLGLLVLSAALFFKPIWRELQKKFHL